MKIDIVQYIQNVKQQNQQAQLAPHFISLRKVDMNDYLIDILQEICVRVAIDILITCRLFCILVASSCPASCKCTPGQHEVDRNDNCNFWCSSLGYCGETENHKENGIDCRGCAGMKRISLKSKCCSYRKN